MRMTVRMNEPLDLSEFERVVLAAVAVSAGK